MMQPQRYTIITATIFTLIAFLQLLRLLIGWSAVIGGWLLPQWASVAALLIAGFLAYQGFSLLGKQK